MFSCYNTESPVAHDVYFQHMTCLAGFLFLSLVYIFVWSMFPLPFLAAKKCLLQETLSVKGLKLLMLHCSLPMAFWWFLTIYLKIFCVNLEGISRQVSKGAWAIAGGSPATFKTSGRLVAWRLSQNMDLFVDYKSN